MATASASASTPTKLSGQRVVVTGASSGIGAALARELAGRGAEVVLVARTRTALEALSAELPGSSVVVGDLATAAGCAAAAGEILAGGVPEVVVHNAGAGRWLAVDETPEGEAATMMAVPYLAAFELTRALTPAMIARRRGRHVYMTSVSAFLHVPGAAGYSAARWAVRGLAGQVRADLRGTGVGVTLLAPAEVDSPYFDHNPGTRERIPRATVLMGGRASTTTIARLGADAVEAGRRTAILPRQAALVVRTTPPPVLSWLAARTGWRHP
ncbi:SDR family NAD(P)-dependent oxidoreductase [Nocardioides marmotae]|uniref:SDR family NAD(P)-dependent oxidoreductase n=1 Tax=Nocardioides marmotae TaxID=2663857 RepID=UPI001659929C|nr:SDR family NAD(P)-dependent oxidoreductase [Nocardioides marmotae]MBC9734108.1 SDR family NAD(P)-dependent oxidoreductase [Nocardioides marmotae]